MVKCLTVEVTKTLLERGGHMEALSPFISQASTILQSSQVKRTLQDFINEFNVRKLNPLTVVDFRFSSAFLHTQKAVNSRTG